MLTIAYLAEFITLAAGASAAPVPQETISADGWKALAAIAAGVVTLATAFMVHARSRYAFMELEIRKLRMLQNLSTRKLERRNQYQEDVIDALREHVDNLEAHFYSGDGPPLPKMKKIDRPKPEEMDLPHDPSMRELKAELKKQLDQDEAGERDQKGGKHVAT